VGTGRTKLHASVAGYRVTVFLATAAPWEPYFTDNPRIGYFPVDLYQHKPEANVSYLISVFGTDFTVLKKFVILLYICFRKDMF
jgi:hypothetical protein